ncbi:MAG: NAD(P)H-hydrate epimerase [Planctomycetes bacterium]|nr:NAD(P)H-hydrate epimerase [Planctomycetota bacterium]
MTPPVLSREQVRRVDRLAVERYGIPSLLLMENAGRSAAEIIGTEYGSAGRAFIVCGSGNNGGDGCVIARHLHNAGWSVRLLMTCDESRMTPDLLSNWRIVAAMNLDRRLAFDAAAQAAAAHGLADDEILVDALLGTGFSGEVRSPMAELIASLNAAGKRATVAVDVPSGLDCETGLPSAVTIIADRTITFVASKVGFLRPAARPYLGRVRVADIGAPRELVEQIAGGPA